MGCDGKFGEKVMAESRTIAADQRTGTGKGAARFARRQGLVPGVVYGGEHPPVSINVNAHELRMLLRDPAFSTYLFDLRVSDKRYDVLARDVQVDPVTDLPIHVDFLRVSKTTVLTVEIPVRFLNEDQCPGLKKGGVLNVVRHGIEVTCQATSIPEGIDIDLSGYDAGASVHISDISLPDGVVPTISDRDFTIATIAASSAERAEAEESEAEDAVADEDAGSEASEG